METQKKDEETTLDGGGRLITVVELPLEVGSGAFNLEKTVCSHGLFMMAPNYWDPQSKTLQRPLRLSLDFDHPDYQTSLTVRISQPFDSPQTLNIQVFGTDSLSHQHRHCLLVHFLTHFFELSFRIFPESCLGVGVEKSCKI